MVNCAGCTHMIGYEGRIWQVNRALNDQLCRCMYVLCIVFLDSTYE
jgi:hypothetical protein